MSIHKPVCSVRSGEDFSVTHTHGRYATTSTEDEPSIEYNHKFMPKFPRDVQLNTGGNDVHILFLLLLVPGELAVGFCMILLCVS